MRLEIDGVPVFYRDVPGPVRATLLFRVGVVDEQLHERGLTHLVEHLALTHAPDSVHAYNGATGPQFTQFSIAGDEADVVEFLELVCAGLREPHFERLEHERAVLKAEASTRNPFTGNDHLIWRFGPKGLAGSAYHEWALAAADESRVQEWIQKYFHAGNCALWITGSPAKRLRLQLPAGEGLVPVPEDIETPVVPVPGVFGRGRPQVALSWVNPDRKGGNALGMFLSERLTQSIRHEAGLAYGAVLNAERLGCASTWQMVSVDATAETARDVQTKVVEVLRGLREQPPTPAEVKKLRTAAELALRSANADIGHLDYWTRETLLGITPVGSAESAAKWRELTPAKLTEHMNVVLNSLLLGVPYPDEVVGLGEVLPAWSKDVFKGALVQPSPSRPKQQAGLLLCSSGGISWAREVGTISIAVAECAGVFRFEDGSVQLYGKDGFTLWLASEQWRGFSEITRWVDRLPGGLVHPAGPRTPPTQPAPAPAARAEARARRRTNWARIAVPPIALASILIASAISNSNGSAGSDNSSVSLPPYVEQRPVHQTSLKPGQCFDGLGTPVGCDLPHQHQVLPVAPQPSTEDQLDLIVCQNEWAPYSSSHQGFTVDVQLQATATGTPDALCVITPDDGKATRSSVR